MRFSEDYCNVGIQIDLVFKIAHKLPMTLSFGYARGFADGGKADNEFIASLMTF